MKRAFIALSTLVLLSACQSEPKHSSAAIPVAAITVHAQAWRASTQTTATVLALQGTILKSEVTGRVKTMAFKPGMLVAKGTLLYEINPAQLAAKLKMSIALAELETANYQRALSLYSQHVISKADFERARASAKNNQATVDAAQASLDEAVIHAPFAGVVGLNLVQEGDYVTLGQALVSLQQLDHLRIDFSVPEQFSDQIRVGDAVFISDSAQHCYQGTVSGVDNAIDVNTRLLAVRATLANLKQNLLPGAFVNVTVFYGLQRTVLAVPQIAVMSSAEGDQLYRIQAGKAIATHVKLGPRFGDQVVIDSGLHVGDVVMTDGQLKVHDGDAVTVQ